MRQSEVQLSIPTLVRQTIWDRDGEACRVCGSINQLEIHHIVFRSKGRNHDYCNLILLCNFCHDQVEKSNLPEWNKDSETHLFHLSPVKGFAQRLDYDKIICDSHRITLSSRQLQPPIEAYQYRKQIACL